MAKIIVTLKGRVLKEAVIPKGATFTIGRIHSNMLVLDNLGVSRQHACIEETCSVYYIEDLKSTNGTRVNGKAVSIKEPLSNNDKISIGKFELIFKLSKAERDGKPVPGGEGTIPTV